MRVVVVLTLVNVLNYLDRYLLQAVKPLVRAEWGVSEQAAGWAVSALTIGYCGFAPVFGSLAHRFSRPKLMAAGAFLWSIATVLTGLAPSFAAMFVARLFTGVGEASFATITPGYLHDRVRDPVRLNSALALFSAAIPVGAALGYVVGGLSAGYLSWHYAFFIGGVPGLVLAAVVWAMPETEGRGAASPPVRLLPSLAALSRHPLFVCAVVGYVFNSFALTGVAAQVVQHGVDIGFGVDGASNTFGGILAGAGLLGSLGGGRVASWFAARAARLRGVPEARSFLVFTGACALAGVPLLAAAVATTDRTLFLCLCFLAELAIFSGTAPVNSVIVLSVPAPLVTFAQGVTIAALNVLGTLPSPVATGWVADRSSAGSSMYLCVAALFVSGVVWTGGALKARAAAGGAGAPSPSGGGRAEDGV